MRIHLEQLPDFGLPPLSFTGGKMLLTHLIPSRPQCPDRVDTQNCVIGHHEGGISAGKHHMLHGVVDI